MPSTTLPPVFSLRFHFTSGAEVVLADAQNYFDRTRVKTFRDLMDTLKAEPQILLESFQGDKAVILTRDEIVCTQVIRSN